jgi:hypothetical protein
VNSFPTSSYKITWIEDEFGIDPADDNVDVTVDFATGERYTATFFTVENLNSIMERYRESGECANGLYIWSSHMIVIERLTKMNVDRAVQDLVQSGEFRNAFEGPFHVES